MNKLVKSIAWAGVAGTLLFGTTNVMAQQERGRGNFDPAQFQERMLEQYQERLGLSAEEFKAVRPLLENVMTKQREAGSGRGMGFGFGGGGGGRGRGGDGGADGGGRRGGGFGQNASPEAEALQKAVESGKADDIKAKLDAYRDSRKKKDAELQDAREKLRKVLTAKQEAQLVLMGTLN